ncbi:MAG TPA: TonB-dependent receptor [Chitinophagaceae bacterium]|nr:TonB-dependent receptor [Chitinophagaceae bacterium]
MKLLFLFLPLLLATYAFAQKNEYGSIKGVVSTSDGKPAGSVTVVIKNTKNGTTTNDDGSFELKKIKPGNYVLILSFVGFESKEISIDVKTGEENFVKAQLEHNYAELQNIILEASKQSKYVETKTSEGLRLNLPLVEIPQNIHVTSHQLISDQGLLSMTEALRTVSGIQKYYGGLNDYQLIIRGAVTQFNVFRNGMAGFWWNQQEDAEMLEKIEFIKGPAGFMMSLNEPGGVVNIVTKQPVKEPIASVNAGVGSYNLFRLATDLGGAFSKKSKFFYRFNTGIHTQNRAFQFSKAYRYFICGAVTYNLNQKTSLTAEYNYMFGKTSGNNENLPSLNGKMFALPKNFAVADANTDQYTVSDNYYRLQARHNFIDNWHLNVLAAYAQGYAHNHQLFADKYIPVSNDTLYRYFDFGKWYSYTISAQAYLDGKFYTGNRFEHKVLAGLDYCNFYSNHLRRGIRGQNNLGLYIPNPNYYINPDLLNNPDERGLGEFQQGWAALYLQDHLKIANKLVVTIAGHFTHAYIKWAGVGFIPSYQRNTKYNAFTPRAGLTWLFSENFSIYSLYDQCFVPPSAVPQDKGNFDSIPFKPVTGYNIETGMKSYFFNKKLGLNFSVYHIVKNNNLTQDPEHPDFFIQTGQITSNGIDLDMTGNITPAFTLNANYAYTDARITNDNDSTLIDMKNFGTPDHSINLWIKYKLLSGKLKGLSFGLGYQYMGKRSALEFENPGTGNVFLPVYNLLDAAVSYQNPRFNISLNLYNITNTTYAALGFFNSSVTPNDWRYTPGEPINFRLSVGINLLVKRRNKISYSIFPTIFSGFTHSSNCSGVT